MPLYELRRNAENRIEVSPEARNAIRGGPAAAQSMVDLLRSASLSRGRTAIAAFEGTYGVIWPEVMKQVARSAAAVGLPLQEYDASGLFKSRADIAAYKKPFLSDDPGFGFVNDKGRIEDIMDAGKISALTADIARGKSMKGPRAFVVFGPGAAAADLLSAYDLIFYFDNTRQNMLWQMWEGRMIPLGSSTCQADYSWKEYYYCDFYLLERQKKSVLEKMDFWIEGIDAADMKLAPRAAYDEIVRTLLLYPVKEVKIFQPGPWGAYRYRDLWNVPGLGCNAWNELAGPELSIIIEVGTGTSITMPVTNLLQHPVEFVGKLIHEELPGMFPLDIWLDDGYFPTPQPAERTSMPIHNHPDTEYVRRRFNEPLGRYETYYIVEAYEGANTWLGFADGADSEEWERLCRASEKTGKPIENWKDFLANWDSNVGDLYLIPPGSTHGHGGNQMVLEMDTVPSIAATEYSFFMYDFCRPSWDDRTKTMTGKPVKLHLDHAFDADRERRASWVDEKLRARPKVVKWTRDYWIDRYSSYGPMPMDIERIHFEKKAQYDTQGGAMHIVTLTVGGRVAIRSKAHPERGAEIEKFQSAVIPACFGAYDVENLTGGFSTLVVLRWKEVAGRRSSVVEP